MTPYLNLAGSVIASVVALTIAVIGWRKSDRRVQEEKQEAVRKEQAAKLAELLELSIDAVESRNLTKHDAKMKAILLTLPGHFATVLRNRLRLDYTMKDVPLDAASAVRLRADETKAGHKWLIFDRSSAVTNRAMQPYPEWIEAELAYDIAGLLGGDQDAVLVALSKDPRATHDAAGLERRQQT